MKKIILVTLIGAATAAGIFFIYKKVKGTGAVPSNNPANDLTLNPNKAAKPPQGGFDQAAYDRLPMAEKIRQAKIVTAGRGH